MPNFFAPNDGQWFPSTSENVTMASEERLQKQLEWQTQLSINMFTQLLVQQSNLFHEKNYSNNPGADPGGIERSSRYGQIFPIMDSKIVLGKLIYFYH
jgi:hypothetical protein